MSTKQELDYKNEILRLNYEIIDRENRIVKMAEEIRQLKENNQTGSGRARRNQPMVETIKSHDRNCCEIC